MSGNTLVAQRSVRGRAGVIGIETRLRLFGPKSCRCGIDAALVPHHVGFRGLQIAHTSQSTVDPVARSGRSAERSARPGPPSSSATTPQTAH